MNLKKKKEKIEATVKRRESDGKGEKGEIYKYMYKKKNSIIFRKGKSNSVSYRYILTCCR